MTRMQEYNCRRPDKEITSTCNLKFKLTSKENLTIVTVVLYPRNEEKKMDTKRTNQKVPNLSCYQSSRHSSFKRESQLGIKMRCHCRLRRRHEGLIQMSLFLLLTGAQEVVDSFVLHHPANAIAATALTRLRRTETGVGSGPSYCFENYKWKNSRINQSSKAVCAAPRRPRNSSTMLTMARVTEPPAPQQPEPPQQPETSAYANQTTITTTRRRRSIVNAALLIAGTTVGGGFLALPTVVAPNGFVPSAVALVGVWLYFWMESMVVVECLILSKQILTSDNCNIQEEGEEGEQTLLSSSSSADASSSGPGISAAARLAFGSIGEKIVLTLLVVLTEATLVSQISRAGAFFSPSFYRIGCTVTAISMAGLVFATPKKVVTETNSILTILFCSFAVSLFGSGVSAADWSNLRVFASWTNVSQAIPTFLQLLVYGEILPIICQLLNYQLNPIRWAITIGSFVPLLLEVGWAALGMGLLPVTSTGVNLGAVADPVDLLLGVGSVRLPLTGLAMAAITTTIIGSYLALKSAMDDVFVFSSKKSIEDDRGKETVADAVLAPRRKGHQSTILSQAMWIVLPALGIASISPNLFLKAIDFAGSYPVLVLWGLAPPVISYRLRQRLLGNTKNASVSNSLLPKWWLLFTANLSFVLFSMSAIPDLASFVLKTMQFST